MQPERFRLVTDAGTLTDVRLVKPEASSVVSEAGSASQDKFAWSLRFPILSVARPVQEERFSESIPLQPEMSSVLRPVQPVMFSVVTPLGTVRLVNLVQPETSSVVTPLGKVRLVNCVQPESSKVRSDE